MINYRDILDKATTCLNNNELQEFLDFMTDNIEYVGLDDGKIYAHGKKELFEIINTGGRRTQNHWEIKETTQVGHKLFSHETFITTDNERTDYMFIYQFDKDHISKVWMSDQ